MDDVAPYDPGFEHRTIGALLRGQAERHGDRAWILFEDERLTFAEVDDRVDRLVAGLVGVGAI